MIHQHCHWSYAIETGYRSPWFWPTQADADQAARTLTRLGGTEQTGYDVYQVHADACTCTDRQESDR